MAYSSSVPAIEFTDAGLVVPAESAVLTGVQADIDAAFGGGLNQALETPQGQLASSYAAVVADKNSEIAQLVNLIDPRYSSGRFQDAIGRLYFLTRKGATATSVIATLGGVPGTVVPAATLAQDTSGNTYALAGAVTIGLSGNADGEWQNVVTGAIPCAAGTLTQVYQAVTGWDTITNAAAGTLGSDEETPSAFEYRRANSVAANARGTLPAIYATVFGLSGVLDVYATENTTSAVVNAGASNYPLAAHSIYLAVVGGTDAEVASAIWSKKDGGCDYNGNTSVTVTDNSGYSYPQPSYVVKFQRPASLPILFAVEIVDSTTLPSDIVSLVKNAILARFNGTDGTTRERIGATILASRYYGAVVAVADNVSLLSILIGTATATLTQVAVGIDQRPTLSENNIAVTLV